MQELIKKLRDLMAEREELRMKGIAYDDFYKIQKIEYTIFANIPQILNELERRL